jgi:hypothetical protein
MVEDAANPVGDWGMVALPVIIAKSAWGFLISRLGL